MEYVVVNTETKETDRVCLSEKGLLLSYNEMVKDCSEDKELIAKDFNDMLLKCKYWAWQVFKVCEDSKVLKYTDTKEVEVNNKELLFLCEQAIKFNSSWTGKTVATTGGYYTFNIKPLYVGDRDITFQIVLNKMTPSGYSDNGIKKVSLYSLNKYAFSEIERLYKFLLNTAIRDKYEIEYIIF